MNVLKSVRLSNFLRFFGQSRTVRNLCVSTDSPRKDAVQYPPVKPKYPPGKWSSDMPGYVAWRIHDKRQILLNLPDVRERLELMAGPDPKILWRIRAFDPIPDILPFKQFVTRTHIQKTLPDIYSSVNVDDVWERLKTCLLDAIIQEQTFLCSHRSAKSSTVKTVVRHLLSMLSFESTDLLRTQVDDNARLETFWWSMGFPDADAIRGSYLGRLKMQYQEAIDMQLRTEMPLTQVQLQLLTCGWPIVRDWQHFSDHHFSDQ